LFKESVLRGVLDPYFENSNGSPRLGFTVEGELGERRSLALYFADPSSPGVGIKDGRQFRTVKLICSDGVRLKVVYEKFRAFNISTLYVSDPSSIYRIRAHPGVGRPSNITGLKRYTVHLRRKMERPMLHKGSSYDHGRLGVEIAYALTKRLFPGYEFAIPEISRGGRDLYSLDGNISVQARLLYDFRQFRPLRPEDVIEMQLRALIRKLGQDYAFNPNMSVGLASLAYFGSDQRLHAILAIRERPTGHEPSGR
jgi:hypothetical protein